VQRDRDRGKPHGSALPTPPDMRVRIRRFGGLSERLHSQSLNPERVEMSIGECDLATAFHEEAASVHRKSHCGLDFMLLRLHICGFCTRCGGGPGRADSACRKGRLDGRCVSRDFVIVEAKEPDIHDCFISPL